MSTNQMFTKLMLAVVGCVLACSTGCSSSGTAASPAAATPATPQLTLSASSLSFGSVTLGATSAAQTITLTNAGTASLTLTSTTLSDTTDYALLTTCGTSLAASASCTVSVSFKPQTAASLPATILLADNATSSPQTVTLTGTGAPVALPQATLSTASLTFPSTTAGTTSSALVVTLTNSGNAPLTGLLVSLSGANATAFAEISTCPSTLAASASCTVSVTFSPAAASTTYSAALTFTDNAAGLANSVQTVSLSGASPSAVSTAQAVLSASSLTFAATVVGTSAGAQSVTLSNPGTATLTGIAISIGGGTASSAFTSTTTCGTTLAAASGCTISVNFTPMTSGTFAATLTIADSAANSPQSISLAGSGTAAPAPIATLSSSSINFATTTVGARTSAYSITLTNSGNATLAISSIVLGGANPTAFSESTTCPATLAAAATCTISATFAPPAASPYSATITVTDNASGSPLTIALSGSGGSSSVSHTLYVFPESDNSVTPLYALVNAARSTIDMTMYALEDTTFSGDLVAACNRGVIVRVILDQNLEKSGNTPAYNQLNATKNCSAVWANTAFQATHQKSFILDGTQVAIMSLNLQSQYYSTTRDYALLENDTNDIAAIQATFNADYAAGTTSTGTVGSSDFAYQPAPGDDLIWSPTTAQAAMLAIINNAKSTLLVENEEMGASNIVSALESACQRGVSVHIAMVSQSSYGANFSALEAAGCGVHVYPDTATGFYIHAKAVIADYGLATQSVYMGSINYSNASMTENRELGLYISDAASVQTLYATITSDYAGGSPY